MTSASENPGPKSRDEIARAYSSEPWWYDVRGFLILTFAYRSTLWNQLRFFGPNIGERHLEVAIGTGTLFELVLGWRRRKRLPVARITGVDYAESMLAGAMHRFRKHPEIELLHADVAAMDLPDAVFDTANVANAVHCFPDVEGALRGIHRVLKPGGTLAANVLLHPRGPAPLRAIAQRINDWGIRKGILYTPYEQDDIRARFLAAGFRIDREEVSGNCLNLLAVKPQ